MSNIKPMNTKNKETKGHDDIESYRPCISAGIVKAKTYNPFRYFG